MDQKICVQGVTNRNFSTEQTINCCPSPLPGTIVNASNESDIKFIDQPSLSSDLSQLSYTILFNPEFVFETTEGCTAIGRCVNIKQESIEVPLKGSTVCCSTIPQVAQSINIKAITSSSTCLNATATSSFTINNLCVPKIISLADNGSTITDIKLVGRKFTSEELNNLETENKFQPTSAKSIAEYTQISYFVYNKSTINSAIVKLDISPDANNWETDTSKRKIPPNEGRTIVPSRFLQYIRLQYKSLEIDNPAILDIWFQAQI